MIRFLLWKYHSGCNVAIGLQLKHYKGQVTRYEAVTVVQVKDAAAELSRGSGDGREWADLRDI